MGSQVEMEVTTFEACDTSSVTLDMTSVTYTHKHWKHRNGRILSRSQSTGDIPMQCFTDDIDGAEIPESPLEQAKKWQITNSNQLLSAILGDSVQQDSFEQDVAQKTQSFMVGRQEAVTEVVIDKLIQKEGSKDKALLHVVSQMDQEIKVQVFVNALLHRGASPSFADNNWQTPLHHAAKKGFKGVVSELLENDALPHVRDKESKFPFHLAIDGCHDEIGAMLLNHMPHDLVRELFITKINDEAECKLHDLLQRGMQESALAVLDCMIDRIGQTSHMKVYYHILEADEKGRPPSHAKFEPNSKSCLHLISKEGYKELITHVVVRLLIRRKWKEYARFRFQINSFMFLLTLLCLTFSVVVATTSADPSVYDTPLHKARAVFEVWSLLAVIVTCVIEMNQLRKHKLDYWRDQFNWIDLGSSSLLLAVVPLRFTHCQEQWQVYSVGYLLWTLRVFKFAAVFRQTGAYAQVLWRIISHDFLQFTILFLVILLSFSGSFILALRGEDSLNVHEETDSFWNVLFTGVRTLIEGQSVVTYAGTGGYRPMSCVIMVVFLFVCCVVLLNILIAQLSDTYQNVQKDAHRGLEMNRAWIITRVELNSLFIGKSYRASKYLEMEELNNPASALEKWESPLLNEVSKDVRGMKESLESTELSMQTIKNRLSRQEHSLKRLEDQVETVIQMLTNNRRSVTSDREFVSEHL
ncbi:hypothetical protein BsWGS_27842 [Bradybaena similaris]